MHKRSIIALAAEDGGIPCGSHIANSTIGGIPSASLPRVHMSIAPKVMTASMARMTMNEGKVKTTTPSANAAASLVAGGLAIIRGIFTYEELNTARIAGQDT